MADEPVVHIGENSPEEVAFKLMHLIIAEERAAHIPNRKQILDLYAECLVTVKMPGRRGENQGTGARLR